MTLVDEQGRLILELIDFPEELVVRVHHRTPTEHDRNTTTPEDRIYTPMVTDLGAALSGEQT